MIGQRICQRAKFSDFDAMINNHHGSSDGVMIGSLPRWCLMLIPELFTLRNRGNHASHVSFSVQSINMIEIAHCNSRFLRQMETLCHKSMAETLMMQF